MKCFAAFILFFGLVGAGVVGFIWSGTYNVAANDPHWEITFKVLEQVRDRSIAAHSKGIVTPPLNDPKLVHEAFEHFHGMCRACHGAPGAPRNEFAMGLYPSPPDLASEDVQKELKDEELFWIIENGLKMTGMPSFGYTHENRELWGIVAFLRQLAHLSPEQYQSMVEGSERHEGEHHHHGSGG